MHSPAATEKDLFLRVISLMVLFQMTSCERVPLHDSDGHGESVASLGTKVGFSDLTLTQVQVLHSPRSTLIRLCFILT